MMNLTLSMNLLSYTCHAKNDLVEQLFLWILYGEHSGEFLSCQIGQTLITNKI